MNKADNHNEKLSVGRIRKDWFWSFTSEVLARLASIVVIAWYFSAFGKEAAGIVVVAYSYVMTCWLLVDIGLGLYGAREVAKPETSLKKLQVEITAARFTASLFAALLAMTFLFTIVNTSFAVALSFGLFLVFRGFSLDWVFRGTSRFKELALINLVAGLTQLLVLLVITEENWKNSIALPFTLWAAIVASLGWWRTATSPLLVLGSISRKSLGHLKDSIAFSFTNGASIIFQQTPVLFLALLYTPAQLAGFAFMHRLMLSTVMVFSSLGAAIFPYLVRGSALSVSGAGKVAVRTMLFIGVVAIFPASAFVVAYTIPYFEQTFFPDLSLGIVFSLATFLVIRSMRVAPMRFLMASNNEEKSAWLNIGAVILYLGILVIFWFIGMLDFLSTAILFTLTELMILTGLLIVSYRLNRNERIDKA